MVSLFSPGQSLPVAFGPEADIGLCGQRENVGEVGRGGSVSRALSGLDALALFLAPIGSPLAEVGLSYLQRYLAGEYEAVWRELCDLGEAVQASDVFSDAEAVARTLMERAAANVDRVIERLEASGYEFGRYPDGEPVPGFRGARIKPTGEMLAATYSLTERVGTVPLSLRLFWQVVGEVVLIGRAPEGGMPDYSDPLWIEGPGTALSELDDGGGMEIGSETFHCPIAPDALHKDNVSGGASYSIALPNGAFDAPLLNEWREVSFVAYLRTAILDWGGFPGLSENSPQQRWRRGGAIAPWVMELRADLQPF